MFVTAVLFTTVKPKDQLSSSYTAPRHFLLIAPPVSGLGTHKNLWGDRASTLTPSDQRDSPQHIALCSIYKTGGEKGRGTTFRVMSFMVLVEVHSLWMFRKDWKWHLEPWSNRLGGVWSKVGLSDFRGLFQPNWFCDPVCLTTSLLTCDRALFPWGWLNTCLNEFLELLCLHVQLLFYLLNEFSDFLPPLTGGGVHEMLCRADGWC